MRKHAKLEKIKELNEASTIIFGPKMTESSLNLPILSAKMRKHQSSELELDFQDVSKTQDPTPTLPHLRQI